MYRLTPAAALACALAAALPGCGHRGYRTPEALREAYHQALARDDPKAAYALLTPEVQSRIAFEQFRARWEAEKADHQAALTELEAVTGAPEAATRAPVRGGTTVHPNGATLEWAEVGGRYLVVSGLPGLPDTSTPAQAIRAFVAAVRAADLAAIEALLSEDLRARLADDWEAQVGAIEARLETPGAIELSADNRQALLRYDGSRALILEQSDAGWKITSLR
ncbi:MAG: hypothetical protein R3B09_22895 [Nannocystaceae bacterium]